MTSSCLLSLPTEIRTCIFFLVVVTRRRGQETLHPTADALPLLFICQRLRLIALGLLASHIKLRPMGQKARALAKARFPASADLHRRIRLDAYRYGTPLCEMCGALTGRIRCHACP